MPADRWFGVGCCAGAQERAGARAVDDALIHDDPKLLIVFCSQAHDLRQLLRQIRERAGDVPLIGCTTAGEIATAGPSDASVVVAALGGSGFAVRTAVATDVSGNLREAGARVARGLPDRADLPHKVVLLLSDGLAGDQQEVVRGAHGVLGAAVPLVGGCAGDDLKMSRTFQLYDDRVLSDSVVAAGIASNAPLGIGVRHGWRRAGEPMLVTSSRATVFIPSTTGLRLTPTLSVSASAEPCLLGSGGARAACAHPSARPGPPERRGQGALHQRRRLRRTVAVLHRRGPAGGTWCGSWRADARSVLEATEAACDDSLAALGGRPPLGMIVFDCVARRAVLGEEGIRSEGGRLAARASGAPVAGFYTYGEIARTRGVRGFHNQTLVVLAIG